LTSLTNCCHKYYPRPIGPANQAVNPWIT
jgi:hypothetical protein